MTIDELKDHFDQRLNEANAHLDERLHATETKLKDDLAERLDDVETKLLREFRKWAMPIEGSRRVQQVLNSNVDERLSALETRVSDLESKR